MRSRPHSSSQLLLGLLLVITILISLGIWAVFSNNIHALSQATPDACFMVDANSGSITGYYANESNDNTQPACTKDVVIPTVINGTTVTSIGDSSFSGRALSSVTIPDGITTIGYYAFGSNQLSAVTIPDSVTSIGDAAFFSNQLLSVTLSNQVSSIGSQAFAYNLLSSVTIPSSVTSIGGGAFQGNKLTIVNILGTLSSIGNNVLIDNAIDSITYGGVTYSASQTIQPIPDGCFEHSGNTLTSYLYIDLKSIVYNNVLCAETSVTLPQNLDGVEITSIGDSALANKHLTSTTLPNSITNIAKSAFATNQLTSIVIPSSVTSIGDGAFFSNQLSSVIIPSGVTGIANTTFQNNKLTSVTIPANVTSIGDYAFSNNQLSSVIVPSSVTTIGNAAFQYNDLASVTIPSGVTSIGDYAFNNNQLSSVIIPSGLTTIGSGTFASNKLTSILIPNGVTIIYGSAFSSNNITTINISGTPTSIDTSAFTYNPVTSVTYDGTLYSANQPVQPLCFSQDNDTLTDYRYLDLMVLINNGVFCGASAIDIPETLNGVAITKIGNAAFQGKQLSSVTIPSGIVSIGDDAFRNNDLTSVVIPTNVSSIGNNAFTYNSLSSLTIENGVTAIGYGTFFGNSITSLVIPNSVTSIDNYAFAANQLTSLTLGCGVDSIGQEMYAINKLREVSIPDCIKTIDPTAFFGQNPWGGTIDSGSDPAHNWYSSDPTILKLIHDNIWYVQLHTSSPSNPNHLIDGVVDEAWYTDDLNGNGVRTDSIGGHLINPAMATAYYVDESGTKLRIDAQNTGRLTNGVNLSDYLVKNVSTPGFSDAEYPTADEQSALELSLSQYYRLGQNVSLTAPTIAGYSLLSPSSPHAISLASKNSTINFIYRSLQSNVSTPIPTIPKKPPTQSPSQVPLPATTAAPNSTSDVNNKPAPSVLPDAPRSKIDFSSPSGSPANPYKGLAPSELSPLLTQSSLKVDETKPCSQITTAQILPSGSFTAPDTAHIVIGGLSFILNCTKTGGEAAIAFTLGGEISDLTQVSIYKQDASGKGVDITKQVSITNQGTGADTRTRISYNLQDGHTFDDDGKANRSITDPIYFVIPNNTSNPTTVAIPMQPNEATVAGTVIIVAGIAFFVIYRHKKAVKS